MTSQLLRGLRRRPCYLDSVGEQVNINYEILHWWEGYLCWKAKGTALEAYNRFKTTVATTLEKYCTDHPQKTGLIVTVYMIGVSESTAQPVLVFVCKNPNPAKEAESIIKKRGILKDYPGFKTATMPILPTGKLVLLAMNSESTFQFSSHDQSPKVYFDRSNPIQPHAMPIFIKHDEAPIRKATANVVYNGKEYGYISAAHAFREVTPSAEATNGWGSDFRLSINSESEYDEEELEELSQHSLSSLEETSSNQSSVESADSSEPLILSTSSDTAAPPPVTASTESSDIPSHHDRTLSIPPFDSTKLIVGSDLEHMGHLSALSVGKDWALIHIRNERVIKELALAGNAEHNLVIRVASRARRAKAIAYTSHGPISGWLSDVPLLMRIPGSNCSEEVYQFEYDEDLRMGDCGSFVVDKETRELYGHVIAGSEGSRTGFVMAASKIMDEIGPKSNWRLVDLPTQEFSATSSMLPQQKDVKPSGNAGISNYSQFSHRTSILAYPPAPNTSPTVRCGDAVAGVLTFKSGRRQSTRDSQPIRSTPHKESSGRQEVPDFRSEGSVTAQDAQSEEPGYISTSIRSIRSSTKLNHTPILKSRIPATRPTPTKAEPMKRKQPMFVLGRSSDEDNSSSLEAYLAKRSSLSDNLKKAGIIRKMTLFKNKVSTRTIQDATSEESEEAIVSESEDDLDDSDDNAIDEEDSDEEWEDDNEDSGPTSADERTMFQRAESESNLVSRRSLLTTMMHQSDRVQALQNAASRSTPAIRRSRASTPNGPSTGNSPQEDGGLMMRQEVSRSKPIIMTTSNVHPPALSPRTTRRNMLQTELTQSLRQNLLWERQQKNATTNAVIKRTQSAVSIPALHRAMTTNDTKGLNAFPQQDMNENSTFHDATKNNNLYDDYFDQGLQEYHQKGW